MLHELNLHNKREHCSPSCVYAERVKNKTFSNVSTCSLDL